MNENKFTEKAGIYAKYRPTYPQDFMDYLYSDIGISDKSIIADIGSGTGIFTQLLLLRNSRVFAVEPNEDMRRVAENNLNHYNNFVSINAFAENTTLNNKSCDFITVAQAFHWFDRVLFKEECKRILKRNGKVIIIYNNRDSANQIVAESEEIIKRYCPAFKGFSGGMVQASPDEFGNFFADGICDFKIFQNDLVYDKQGFIGRSLSSSYAPKKCDESYNSYINALESLFERHSIDGRLSLPTGTSCFVGKVE